jgi:4-hydroxy-4-methyl-2-oxoglutarate aldolase
MLTSELVARLARVKVADLADGCRRLGVRAPTTDPSMRPATPYSRLIGTAVIVRNFIGSGEVDYADQAAELYGRGRSVPFAVVVQRNEVPDFTSIGSGGARVARAHGYAGWLTSGPLRDTDELRDLGFPVFGTSVVPSGRLVSQVPAGQSIHFEFDVTVEAAGMSVAPGDIVIGDNDGMIAIKPDRIEAVLAEAEAILVAERRIFDQLDRGLTYREIIAAERASKVGD